METAKIVMKDHNSYSLSTNAKKEKKEDMKRK